MNAIITSEIASVTEL